MAVGGGEHLTEMQQAGSIVGYDVAARTRETRGETCADWIGDLRKHDRNIGDFLSQRRRRRRALGHDDVRRQSVQLLGKDTHPAGIAGAPAYID
jgi:hypothetical protein